MSAFQDLMRRLSGSYYSSFDIIGRRVADDVAQSGNGVLDVADGTRPYEPLRIEWDALAGHYRVIDGNWLTIGIVVDSKGRISASLNGIEHRHGDGEAARIAGELMTKANGDIGQGGPLGVERENLDFGVPDIGKSRSFGHGFLAGLIARIKAAFRRGAQ